MDTPTQLPDKKDAHVKKDATPSIEWEFPEAENEWQSDWANTPSPSESPSGWAWRWWLGIGVIAVLLFAFGAWVWVQGQIGLDQVGKEVAMAVEADAWVPQQGDALAALQLAATQQADQKPVQKIQSESNSNEQAFKVVETQLVELGEDWAVVDVTLQQEGRAYNQRRVYRSTQQGWLHVPSSAAFWGKPSINETEYFIFHYYAGDKVAVTAAAAKLEVLYPTLVATYRTPPLPEDKREIWITPEMPAEGQTGQSNRDLSSNLVLVVSSPSSQLLPAEMDEGEVLVESVLLKLLGQLGEEVTQRTLSQGLPIAQVRSLLQSVAIWQAWNDHLPLAALRQPLVQWIYANDKRGTRAIPQYNGDLCDRHRLWKDAPLVIQSPLFCGEAEPGDPYQLWRYLYSHPWQLNDRSIFSLATPSDPTADPAAEIGLATVLEYAAATYGSASIATLIAYTPNHSSWKTIIRATFGVSLADFEEGWQSYLRQKYGIESR